LQKQLSQFEKEKADIIKSELLSRVKQVNGINFIAEKIDLDNHMIKDLAFQIRGQIDNLFMVLATDKGGKANISVMISDNLVKEKNLNAGSIVKDLAKEINGGGGGQAFFATAGGTNSLGIPVVLKKAGSYLEVIA
jgi:alanyl-tRNA synthetase